MNTKHTAVVITPAERAAQLPEPEVGRVVKVPLECWPAYAARYGLEVVGADKRECVVICKREEQA